MKRQILLFLALTISALAICSCQSKNEKTKEENTCQDPDRFLIIHSEMSQDRQIADDVASMLLKDGHEVELRENISEETVKMSNIKAVISVGRSETVYLLGKDTKIPHLYCITDGGVAPDTDRKGIAPTIESASLADAAMILLPNAEDFSIISNAEGASDVQDACDLFDRTGMDYTVESLEGRIYGEVLLSCLESDTDALLLPPGSCGSKNSSAFSLPYIPESYVPVIAVGIEDPLNGALATFCIDPEPMAKALYSLINSEVYGYPVSVPESFYVLFINKARAVSLDERAKKNISELYNVIWIE
ncbi:MAG: hypothetical protein IJA52_04775 [Clostridia bacterium]|nr:hypothetical protein [Clostridia bacterium]